MQVHNHLRMLQTQMDVPTCNNLISYNLRTLEWFGRTVTGAHTHSASRCARCRLSAGQPCH